jgi:hypothetical protein
MRHYQKRRELLSRIGIDRNKPRFLFRDRGQDIDTHPLKGRLP